MRDLMAYIWEVLLSESGRNDKRSDIRSTKVGSPRWMAGSRHLWNVTEVTLEPASKFGLTLAVELENLKRIWRKRTHLSKGFQVPAVKATETRMWQGCVFWSLLGPSRFLGNCTEEGKERKSLGIMRGEQREIPVFRKEVEDVSTEDQT